MSSPGLNIDLGNVPEQHHARLREALQSAREVLESGQSVERYVLVHSPMTMGSINVRISGESDGSRERDIGHARQLALHLNSQWVLAVAESWALPRGQVHLHEDILEKYGSVANYPGRIDVLSVVLETRDRYYATTPEIIPHGISKKKRTFAATPATGLPGVISFVVADYNSQGTMTGFLPKRQAS